MGAQDKPNNSMRRVKVYRLNDDGKWDDQGTGHVTVNYLKRSEEPGLFVVDEEDNETLLLHRISSEEIYRKQEDTIISWRDPEYSSELALSFQENTGCSYIWDQICSVRRSLQFKSLSSETDHAINSDLRELPPVELSTLPLLLKTVVENSGTDKCCVAELILHDQEFFGNLMSIFRFYEDLEDIDGLHMIYKIVRGIMLLNSAQILERIFGEELIIDIIGCLEYDPDVPHVHHRNFLKDHVVFKEAIPIKDPKVLSKIHQTYRVRYLKDVILPRALDDATLGSFNSILHSNNAFVIAMLKDDSTFIKELFARLKAPTNSAESRKNLVLFLHEFCCLSKSLQMVHQLQLLRDLMSEGIIEVIADILQSPDKKLVLTGTDILILFLNQDPNLTRNFVTRHEGIPLLGLLVKGMLTDFGDDMHCQFVEILRILLDSISSGSQRDTIIEIFYEKHLNQLIDVITLSCPLTGVNETAKSQYLKNETSVKPEILLNICDLLCFCLSYHPSRIKCSFLSNNVVDKVLCLTRRRENYLVVGAVRFVRVLISQNDDQIMNHIVKNNLLKPIIDAFVQNGKRYNLLNSAVLALFENIRKMDKMILLKYLVDSCWFQLVKFENLPSIHSLKVRYEQSLERLEDNGATDVLDSRRRTDERALEKEEEDYFNGDSDEEDSESALMSRGSQLPAQSVVENGSATSQLSLSSRDGGLVDYSDDEGDKDYRPPPRKHAEESEENEGTGEPFRLKRKLTSKEPELIKRRRLCINPKSKDSVFAALCSTLSQVVLPSKKTTSSGCTVSCASNSIKNSDDVEKLDNHVDNEPSPSPSPKSCSDSLHCPQQNRRPSGDDCPSVPPKSSAEMAGNGS